VPVVAWTALSLGLSPAPLVVGEESNPALDEGLDQVPIGQAVGLFTPRIHTTEGWRPLPLGS
jgi:hypothetical protein